MDCNLVGNGFFCGIITNPGVEPMALACFDNLLGAGWLPAGAACASDWECFTGWCFRFPDAAQRCSDVCIGDDDCDLGMSCDIFITEHSGFRPTFMRACSRPEW